MDSILHGNDFQSKATSEEIWRNPKPDDTLSSLLTLRLAPTNNDDPTSLGLNSNTQNCMWLLREVSSDDTKFSSLTSLSKDADINKLIQSPTIREIAIAQKRPRLSLCDNSSPGSPATECNTPTSTAPKSKSLRYLSGDDVEDGEEAEGSYKRKLRLDKDQFALLEDIFAKHQRLTPKHKAALAKQLNVRTRQVEVWFQNRRARTKVKQTELEREKLKSHCDALIEENRRLQLLVQELRSHQAATGSSHKSDIWDSQRTNISMSLCPSCQKITPIGNLFPQKNQDGASNSFVNHQQQYDIKPLNLL